MSRRYIPARQPGVTVVVGWDNPMSTFFAQVTRVQDDDDERDPVMFWIGGMFGEVCRAEDLAQPLAPYADLTAADIGQLRADRAASADRGPTELQRVMRAGLGRRS